MLTVKKIYHKTYTYVLAFWGSNTHTVKASPARTESIEFRNTM